MAKKKDVAEVIEVPTAWKKYLAKFSEIETTKVSQWTSNHQLAYICKMYESTYGQKYSFSFVKPPSRCTELFFVKRMMASLMTTNPKKIKNYIDWVFEQKIIAKGVKIRSLGLFTTVGFVNEFNMYNAEKNKIYKHTQLPDEYQEIANSMELSVNTYGDLAFVKQAIASDPESESRKPYKMLFHKLLSVGFEENVLDDLK